MFTYWYNLTDTTSAISKINMWSYINIRIFKLKINNYIVYFILSLNNLEIKKLKIFYKNNYFDYIYIKILPCIIIIIIFISIFIFI